MQVRATAASLTESLNASTTLITGEFEHGKFRIKYRWRAGAQDRRSLIVIFSGFRAPGTLDFVGAPVQGLRSDILWIEDDLDGMNSYYLGSRTRTDFQLAVVALINDMAVKSGVTAANICVAGFSKGASAALYYGMQFGFKNILAVVPQFRVGNYVKKQWPKVHEFMIDGDESHANELDQLLPNLARSADLSSTNIYLISSHADPWHEHEIEPNLDALRRAGNFNLILSESDLVDSHIAVTRYNVPIIVSLFQAFGEGIYPRIGEVTNGHKGIAAPISSANTQGGLESRVTKAELRNGRFYLEGDAIFRGIPSAGYAGLQRRIGFVRGSGERVEFPLGTLIDKTLSTTWYNKSLVDYSAGKFATLRRYGIDVKDLGYGSNELHVSMTLNGNSQTAPLPAPRDMRTIEINRGDVYVVQGSGGAPLQLVKVDGLRNGGASEFFRIDEFSGKNGRLFVEGRYIIRGVAHDSYRATTYALTLQSSQARYSFDLGVLQRPINDDEPHDPWMDFSYSTFSTPKRQGLELGIVAPGTYSAHITVVNGSYVSSQKLSGNVTVEARYPASSRAHSGQTLPVISVVGSRATHDNFNLNTAPRWKSYANLGPVQYQMSLISLVSAPVSSVEEDWRGMDDHARTVTQRDFTKTYFAELAQNKPDVVIIDAFADARFPILRIGDSWVTHNDWKLPYAAGYATWKSGRRMSMAENRDEYLGMFREAVNLFKTRVQGIVPQAVFIVNQARNVEGYLDTGAMKRFNADAIASQNASWDELDRILIEELNATPLQVMVPGNHSTTDHPWGKGPVHYDASYYERFECLLREKLGYTVDFKVANHHE